MSKRESHILLGTYFFPLLEKNLFQMTGRYTYIDIMFGKFIVFDFIAYLVGMSKQQICIYLSFGTNFFPREEKSMFPKVCGTYRNQYLPPSRPLSWLHPKEIQDL
jgi:hypothetical protein